MKTKSKSKVKAKDDPEALGKMLVNIYETGYIDRNQAYKMSFIKGVLAGLGGVIGATIVVALIVWFLSFFNEVPLVKRIVPKIQNTINSSQKSQQ
jgi:hypothetical protein